MSDADQRAAAVDAFDLAPSLMGVVEPTDDGDVLHVRDNRAACAFFGVGPVGTSHRLASALGASRETISEWLRHYRASAASGQPVRFEYAYATPQGEEWLLVIVRPLGPGPTGRPRFMYVADDITPKKRAERAAEISEQRFCAERDFTSAVIDTAGALVLVLDREGRITRFNRTCESVTGRTAADVLGRPLWDFGFIAPEEMAGVRNEWERLVSGRFPSTHENDWVATDGSRRTIAWSNTALRGPDGEVEFIIATGIDVTEQKRLIERLREADRRKDDFLATLAHELRNPLAPIRNAVQILKVRGEDDPKLGWSRDIIDRQVHHMTRMLEDLLDVSRISRDKLELRRERVDVASIVDAAIETSRPLVDAGRHHLSVRMPKATLSVDGDPVRLAQIFSNLLNNAAKYTPEGGTITLTVEPRASSVVVSVSDDGIGIARDMLPRVFDIFSQAAPALGRAQGGLGIGLSLVKGLVDLHGGSVAATSDGPNRGSRFTVTLPLSAAMSADEPGGHGASAHAPKCRVLVVDDNADGADTLAALMEIMGSEVTTAYDGEEALAKAETFRPTVMLLDIGMPRMNGYDVCRTLRRSAWGGGVFVVAMTGWGQEEDRQKTQEAGFDAHLVKPIDTKVLLELLAHCVSPREATARQDTARRTR